MLARLKLALILLNTRAAALMQLPAFGWWNAHMFGAFFVLSFFHTPKASALSSIALLAIAALKEFIYDRRFEKNPPQSWEDCVIDFAAYASGVSLHLLAL